MWSGPTPGSSRDLPPALPVVGGSGRSQVVAGELDDFGFDDSPDTESGTTEARRLTILGREAPPTRALVQLIGNGTHADRLQALSWIRDP